ncbi:hypothetical protein ACRQ5Q_15275 [Bradyrhizobium sp. PMVTL-01]|uniref:hypothetical protein n=1 Tax=Bradyrhizobium sp. PMVTL-01 TaxID=3434999 RepID=UPI003F72FFFC
MNLRILKKLSARAAPLLPLLGDQREQFLADKADNCTGLLILARKHFERMRSPHSEPSGREESIKVPARDGRGYIAMWPPHSPRKGTVMVGGMSGYYEPEWDEETAWEALRTLVIHHFMDWDESGPTPTRKIRTPSEVFAAAHDIIAEARI